MEKIKKGDKDKELSEFPERKTNPLNISLSEETGC